MNEFNIWYNRQRLVCHLILAERDSLAAAKLVDDLQRKADMPLYPTIYKREIALVHTAEKHGKLRARVHELRKELAALESQEAA
jgi:hypothetical protein